MTHLEKIYISSIDNLHQLRLDWSNDRHHAVQLQGLDAESVEKGLLEASRLVQQERYGEYL